jgi:hypothetical protein
MNGALFKKKERKEEEEKIKRTLCSGLNPRRFFGVDCGSHILGTNLSFGYVKEAIRRGIFD